jgi:DNA-binding beta-propeller fold protein YncE
MSTLRNGQTLDASRPTTSLDSDGEEMFDVSLVAGKGSFGSNNGIGYNATFSFPHGIVLSSDGSYALVLDSANHMIRKIFMSTSEVSFVAGNQTRSPGLSNGIGSNAMFGFPMGIALTSDDTSALIADTYNNMIRKIILSTSKVSLVSGEGAGSYGSNDRIGSNAMFRRLQGIIISSDDTYTFVTDSKNFVIRKIVLSTSAVSLFAGIVSHSEMVNGIGTNARFSSPTGHYNIFRW